MNFFAINFFLKIAIFGKDNFKGIQKIHKKDSYRLGGGLIFLSILIACIINIERLNMLLYFIGILPIFFIGFLEDVYKEISVSLRLIFIFISSTIIILISGSVEDADLKFFNAFLQIPFMPHFYNSRY